MGRIGRQFLLTSTRRFSTATSSKSGSEKIVASVLFERLPVVIPKIDPVVYAFQEFSFRWRQQYRRQYPEAFLKKADTRGKGDYQIDFTPAPRITAADKSNDKKSLQRALDRRLYLLVYGSACDSNGNPVWHFPEKVYESEPTLRKANKIDFCKRQLHLSVGVNSKIGRNMGKTASFGRFLAARTRGPASNCDKIVAVPPLIERTLCDTAFNRRTLFRSMSNVPENSVYGGPKPQNPNQRVTLTHLRQKYKKGERITMVTAYDYPSAVHLDTAGIDICLVGDSAAMVVHGYDTTLPITLDEMLVHCRAVARGAKSPLLVGDLPFGSYESSTNQAVDTAVRVLKEGGMDAIKLEGGAPSRITAAKAIVEAGIAVIGHVGLTPQAISVLGGFRPQGRNVDSALKVVETSIALQEAGCFAVVLECVPAPVAAAATSALRIPTIGIGAGPHCSGQVLVYHDLLGMLQHPHHAKVTPKFCKQYAQVGDIIGNALSEYKKEVTEGSFPGLAHSPYKISAADTDSFLKELHKMGLGDAASAAADAAHKIEVK